MRTRTQGRRGLTLIELFVAMAVMLVAVAAATTLMIAAVRMARDRTGNTEAAERARLASAEMLENLERAGLGASTQLTINLSGTPTQIMPIYTVDNSSNAGVVAGTDELWIVTPSRLALGEACFDTGAKTPITGSITPPNIPVACNLGFTSYTGAGRFVMMLSGQGNGKAGLLSTPGISGATTVTSGDTTAVTGFGTGDSVVGVQVLHYYIALNPNDKDNPNDPAGIQHPALFRANGQLTGIATAPFANAPTPPPVAEIADVEDLQLVTLIDTGTHDPNTYVANNGTPPQPLIVTPNQMKAMRVTLVSRAHQQSQVGDSNTYKSNFGPLTIENHTPVATTDGYQRVTFGRRVELPNMAMTSF